MTTTSSSRTGDARRATSETTVRCRVRLDGNGAAKIATGLPFLDHMLDAMARHSGIAIDLHCEGDLQVCDHHSVEDCALVLGQALDQALGDRRGIARFGHAYVPLDEALARAVVDLSGRPWPRIELGLRRERIGTVSCENLTHFLNSLAIAGRMSLHVDVLRGDNDHHRAEAAFKALARALATAVALQGSAVPSTKGVL